MRRPRFLGGGAHVPDEPEEVEALEDSGPAGSTLDGAPAPVAWDVFMDRRAHRLKRGKHFVGEPKILQREAKMAAEERGRIAIFSRDSQGKWGYVWVQFLDAEVKEDEPCPVCGAHELLKLNNDVIRCPSCGSMLSFVPHPLEMPARPPVQGPAPPRTAGRDQTERAELVSAQVLREDGALGGEPSLDEPLTIEVTVRALVPGLWTMTAIAMHVEEQRISLMEQPAWVELERPGVYTTRARLPARLLARHKYRVKVVVSVSDPARDDCFRLVRRTAFHIRPRGSTAGEVLARGLPEGEELDLGFLRPSLEWTTELVEPDEDESGLLPVETAARS